MFWGDPEGKSFEYYKEDRVITLRELPWVEVKDPKVHYPYLK
jgi:hypothetical protein